MDLLFVAQGVDGGLVAPPCSATSRPVLIDRGQLSAVSPARYRVKSSGVQTSLSL